MQAGIVAASNLGRNAIAQRKGRIAMAILIFVVPAFWYGPTAAAQSASAPESPPAAVHVDATPSHVIKSFDPDSALGSSIDVLSHDGIDKVYTPHIIQESLSAGWGPITYRNNSELRMAAWHWTENGTWSDPERKSGYFTGSTELKEPTRYILSYALPHRGFSTSGDRPLQGPNPIQPQGIQNSCLGWASWSNFVSDENYGPNSHADPDHPPIAMTQAATSQTAFTLPKASITVLRGKVAGLGEENLR